MSWNFIYFREESPAQALIGSFLVYSHHIHELQACPLKRSPHVNGTYQLIQFQQKQEKTQLLSHNTTKERSTINKKLTNNKRTISPTIQMYPLAHPNLNSIIHATLVLLRWQSLRMRKQRPFLGLTPGIRHKKPLRRMHIEWVSYISLSLP